MITQKIAVVLEDHKLFGDVFCISLERIGYFSSVVIFNQEHELMQYLTTNQTGQIYIFMDFFLSQNNTFYLIGDIRKFYPSASIVMVSSVSSTVMIRKILLQKVDGFISKLDGMDQIVACLNNIAKNKVYLSPAIRRRIDDDHSDNTLAVLTTRELEILALISRGLNVEQIAAELGLSKHTVHAHRKNMLAKSNHSSFAELVTRALEAGIFPPRL